MAGKITRKSWPDNERIDLWRLETTTQKTAEEIADILNRKYNLHRTWRAVNTEYRRLRTDEARRPQALVNYITMGQLPKEGVAPVDGADSASARKVRGQVSSSSDGEDMPRRRTWRREEDVALVRLKAEGIDSIEIAQRLSRTSRYAVDSRYCTLNKEGKVDELLKEQMPERYTSAPSVASEGRRIWSPKQQERLWALKQERKLTSLQIADVLKEEFGVVYTRNQIDSEYSRMTRFPEVRPKSLVGKKPLKYVKAESVVKRMGSQGLGASPKSGEVIAVGGLSLGEGMSLYDKDHFAATLKKREEFLYGLMQGQATRLRHYDSFARFRGADLASIMRENPAERKKIAQMLAEVDASPQISAIELLAIPGYGENRDGVSLVLPVFLEDAERTEKNLRSAINEIAVMTLLRGRTGFKQARPFKDRFRDLVAYKFSVTRQPDYEQLGRDITEQLKEEYPGLPVHFYEDIPLLGLETERE